MTVSQQEGAKCRSLKPSEVDSIFFPGTGGKVTKARRFCNGCPISRECLIEAIEFGYEGFWAGTSKVERKVMATTFHVSFNSREYMPDLIVTPILDVDEDEFKEVVILPKLNRRKRRRIIAVAI